MKLKNAIEKSVIIIGAGPAGLTAALQLSQQPGFRVTLLEASSQVGGMAKTIQIWNQKVDLGPHRFFTFDQMVNAVFDSQLGHEVTIVTRLTRILYDKKFYFYPLKMWNVISNLGFFESARCLLSFIRTRVIPEKDQSHFEGWVSHRFGRRLYSMFFKTYSEKLWGLSCDQLDAEFATQRIKQLSFIEALKKSFFVKTANPQKSLIEQFKYPSQGAGSLYEKMAQNIINFGQNILLSSPVKSLDIKKGKACGVFLNDGSYFPADFVISTMPLPILMQGLPRVPAELITQVSELKFRQTILVYLLIDQCHIFFDQWVYIHSQGLRTGRITNFRNWSKELYGQEKKTILTFEYWCNDNDEIWNKSDLMLIDQAKKDFQKSGLSSLPIALDGHIVRVPNCYPVYSVGYRDKLSRIQKYLDQIEGLLVIGRAGAFKYNNQDHSILMGILAAKNIQGEKNDLWAVNNDYEYQEIKK